MNTEVSCNICGDSGYNQGNPRNGWCVQCSDFPDDPMEYDVKCCVCGKQETFRDETIEDCWWQFDFAGWAQSINGDRQYCGRCLNE